MRDPREKILDYGYFEDGVFSRYPDAPDIPPELRSAINPAPTLEIAYADGRKDEREEWEARILPLLMELEGGVLSESQCAGYWGGDLLDWRMASRPAPHPFAQEGTF